MMKSAALVQILLCFRQLRQFPFAYLKTGTTAPSFLSLSCFFLPILPPGPLKSLLKQGY